MIWTQCLRRRKLSRESLPDVPPLQPILSSDLVLVQPAHPDHGAMACHETTLDTFLENEWNVSHQLLRSSDCPARPIPVETDGCESACLAAGVCSCFEAGKVLKAIAACVCTRLKAVCKRGPGSHRENEGRRRRQIQTNQ